MIKDLFITHNNEITPLILDVFGDIPNPAEYTYQILYEVLKKPDIDKHSAKTGVPGNTQPVDIGHSRYPIPLLLVTKTDEQDGIKSQERNCFHGRIGTIYRKQPIPLMLTHAFKLSKYGA
jgi:2,3-bisphosphoglycerate-independent phosphoglycerate mutase